jgi:flagellar biogenesis protein FliO
MKSTPKWWLLPPAVAALLVLGSLSMQNDAPRETRRGDAAAGAGVSGASGASGASGEAEAPGTVRPAARSTDGTRREAAPLPRTPDLSQAVALLAGVLALGGGGLLLLRRLRGAGGRAPRGVALLALRQTLRLSARQAVHAVEFDERILLVGEGERGLVLLDAGRLPERAADEAEVAARANTPESTDGDDDGGAVPKNLVIPRPPQPAVRRAATPPATKSPSAPALGLADFRNLLQKAGRS